MDNQGKAVTNKGQQSKKPASDDSSDSETHADSGSKSDTIPPQHSYQRQANPTRPLIQFLEASKFYAVIVAVFIGLLIYDEHLIDLLDRVESAKVGDVELSLTKLDKATSNLPPELTKSLQLDSQKRFIQRAQRNPELFKDVKALVIQDNEERAKALVSYLSSLGFLVDIAICGDEAESRLINRFYDFVISDIKWDACSDHHKNGLEFLQYAKSNRFNRPTIFYITDFKFQIPLHPTLQYGFAAGITDRLDEVLHLIIDVLERPKV